MIGGQFFTASSGAREGTSSDGAFEKTRPSAEAAPATQASQCVLDFQIRQICPPSHSKAEKYRASAEGDERLARTPRSKRTGSARTCRSRGGRDAHSGGLRSNLKMLRANLRVICAHLVESCKGCSGNLRGSESAGCASRRVCRVCSACRACRACRARRACCSVGGIRLS